MRSKITHAQDYFKSCSVEVAMGFNRRLGGESFADATYHSQGRSDYAGIARGWDIAEEAIHKGEIYYTHNMHTNGRCHAFQYGGTWVCNGCGRGLSMPIRPENKARYPKNWKEIRAAILERAKHCCEGSPDFPDCRVENYAAHPDTGSKVVLTIAHLDHTPEHNDHGNLKAMCQRCHLNYDKEHHAKTRFMTRRKIDPTDDMFIFGAE